MQKRVTATVLVLMVVAVGCATGTPATDTTDPVSVGEDLPTATASGGDGPEPPTGATTWPGRTSTTTTATPSTTVPQSTTTTVSIAVDPTVVTTSHPGSPHGAGIAAGFTSAEMLATSLAVAERILADPSSDGRATLGGALAEQARIQQQAYRDLVDNPEWMERAREAVPEALRPAFDLNVTAGTRLRRLTDPQPGLPDWRIVAPPPVAELLDHYTAAEEEYGVPWSILAAIHLVETRFGRIRGDSHAGAQGPMQFMPATWDAYGEGDVTDTGDAIRAAARYLVAHGAPDDLDRALYAYNHSDHYVAAIRAHAEAMERFDHYLAVYHQWQVYYRTVDGVFILDEGYGT